MQAAEGLRAVESSMHRASAFGLVDHDEMDAQRMAELESDGVFPLPTFSVESLYYSTDMIGALVAQQARIFGLPAD